MLGLAFFLLASCATLPKPEGDQVLLVIYNDVINKTGHDVPIDYEIRLNTSENPIHVKGDTSFTIRTGLPRETITQATIKAYDYTGRLRRDLTFDLELSMEPGTIAILPVVLLTSMISDKGMTRYGYDFERINQEYRTKIVEKLESYRNYYDWQVMLVADSIKGLRFPNTN